MADPVNHLEMSDEDFLNAPVPDFEAMAKEVVVDEPKDPENTEEVKDPEADPSAAQGDEPGAKEGEGEGEDPAKEPGEKEDPAAEATGTKEPEAKTDPAAEPKEKTEAAPKTEAPAIDYKAEYERLIGGPIKANGKAVKVESVEDAIALMQMGANYNKKMGALKPNLKLLKLLENNGLLSEEKIGFLIDLDKKDPAAISKLITDSGIDPMDVTADKASAYKQTPRTVDDREIDLDSVLDDLKGTETYTRTLDVVGNKWDAASKQVVGDNPELLRVINDHIERGIYDVISTKVDNERMLGRLKGMSDIEAYRQVGDAIQAAGGFNHLGSSRTEVAKPTVVEPKPKVEDDKLKDKRRAASSTKPVAPKSSSMPADYNPLAMSDEEFLKMATPKFN